MSGIVTRQDCINIVKEVLGDSVKVSLERSEARVKKLEEHLSSVRGPLGGMLRHQWSSGIDGKGAQGHLPHLNTRRVVTGTDPKTGRAVVEDYEESPQEYVERMARHVGARSSMFGSGLGRAPIKDSRGILGARYARMMVLTGGDFEKAFGLCRQWEDKDMPVILEQARDLAGWLAGSGSASQRDYAIRALGTNVATSGGVFAPPEYSAEIVDILHARVVVMALGTMSLPLEGGQLVQPFLDTGATVSQVGENDAVNATEPTTGDLTLNGHELHAVVPIGNKLMASASIAVDALIRNHLVMQFKKKMDLNCIRGDGSSNSVRGLLYWVQQNTNLSTHQFARGKAGADSTVDEITEDLTKAMAAVEGEDLPLDAGGWIMSVRDKYGLFRRRGTDGHLVFEPEMRAGVLWGFPFGATTQIPTNLSTDKSEVYFADFSTCIQAERAGIEVETVRGGAYNDATGAVVSGLSRRQTVVSATAEHDFGCLYRGKEVAMITTVDWGT